MSDNVTPLHPDQKPKPKLTKRVLRLCAVVLVVSAVVGVIVFRQELNLDRIRRYATHMGTDTSNPGGVYQFDAHSANSYATFQKGLAIATVAGLDVYDSKGNEWSSLSKSMSAPAVAVGNSLVMAYDVGGTSLMAVSEKKGTVLELDTGKTLFDADISPGDEICYATTTEGYKTLLTVLDRNQTEIYKWYSSGQYMPLCAISDGGGTLAAISMGQNNGAFESTACLFPTAKEEPGPTLSLGNQLIYDLAFLTPKKLVAVGENNLTFFGTDGQLVGEYSYEGSFLGDFSLQGHGFTTLALNQYQAGSRYSLVTVDDNGKELANLFLGEEVLHLSAAGNYVAVLTSSSLQIYTSDLRLYAQKEDITGTSKVLMQSDGSCILVRSGAAELYLP